jgi:hypothetical protein
MTALTDTIEAALLDAHDQDVSLRRYAETAARAVEPLIRAAEAAALDRAAAVGDHYADADYCAMNYAECCGLTASRMADQVRCDIRALPRDGSALDTVVATRTAGLREALVALVSASLNDMTTQGLPLEWSQRSAIAQAFRVLGLDCDRLTPEARALLTDNWIDGFDGAMPNSKPPLAKLDPAP